MVHCEKQKECDISEFEENNPICIFSYWKGKACRCGNLNGGKILMKLYCPYAYRDTEDG